MTINIRYNVFETNSSSVHTLVWHGTDEIINDDYMEIHGGYYGRTPQEPLTTIEERLNYLWSAIWDNCIQRYDYDAQKFVSNYDELNTWKKLIHKYCPNAQLFDINYEDWYGVDHPYELRNLFSAMLEDNTILKDFLLDEEGIIYIYGDEYDEDEMPFDYNDMPKVSWFEYGENIIKQDDAFIYVKGN